jgi:hypothetical protein
MSEPTLTDPPASQVSFVSIERRETVRSQCLFLPLVHLLVRPSFYCVRAFVQDVSRTGIRFLLNRSVDLASVVAFQLRNDQRGNTRILSARVIHLLPQEDDYWLAGCRLTSTLTEPELAFLIERA